MELLWRMKRECLDVLDWTTVKSDDYKDDVASSFTMFASGL